jgi:hypothetical protein
VARPGNLVFSVSPETTLHFEFPGLESFPFHSEFALLTEMVVVKSITRLVRKGISRIQEELGRNTLFRDFDLVARLRLLKCRQLRELHRLIDHLMGQVELKEGTIGSWVGFLICDDPFVYFHMSTAYFMRILHLVSRLWTEFLEIDGDSLKKWLESEPTSISWLASILHEYYRRKSHIRECRLEPEDFGDGFLAMAIKQHVEDMKMRSEPVKQFSIVFTAPEELRFMSINPVRNSRSVNSMIYKAEFGPFVVANLVLF